MGQADVRFHAFKIKANIKGMQTRAGMDAEELQNTEFYGTPDIKVFLTKTSSKWEAYFYGMGNTKFRWEEL